MADILQDPSGQSIGADASADLSRVFHRLNNQLGVILANAELLEARLLEDTQRARAGQVVVGALEAIAAVQDLRRLVSTPRFSPRGTQIDIPSVR